MATIDFNGGDSVYCINQSQLKRAYSIVENQNDLQSYCNEIRGKLDRNQQAALAFILIDHLQHSDG